MNSALTPLRIVIASAGRRVYLVRWFQQALETAGIGGTIIATDRDPNSAALQQADMAIVMPAMTDPAYPEAMLEMIESLHPQLLFSVNDYEIDLLAGDLGAAIQDRGTLIPGVRGELIGSLTDKYAMARLFSTAGISTPATVLASDTPAVWRMSQEHARLVVKHRFSSGSVGLQTVAAEHIIPGIDECANQLRAAGRKGPEQRFDDIVVQPLLDGPEYGLDLIGSLTAGEHWVLARKKLRMRQGETDQAVSVSPAPFNDLGDRLHEVLAPNGPIDIDVIADSDSGEEMHVIDVNPRFGGGYAFSHASGADVPLYYVQTVTGRQVRTDCMSYAEGVIASKFIDIAVSEREN